MAKKPRKKERETKNKTKRKKNSQLRSSQSPSPRITSVDRPSKARRGREQSPSGHDTPPRSVSEYAILNIMLHAQLDFLKEEGVDIMDTVTLPVGTAIDVQSTRVHSNTKPDPPPSPSPSRTKRTGARGRSQVQVPYLTKVQCKYRAYPNLFIHSSVDSRVPCHTLHYIRVHTVLEYRTDRHG